MILRKRGPADRKIADNIREHGCQVQFVFDPGGEHPDFAYSIGFPVSVGQPEVIVFGLPRELMISMVNEVRRQCAEDNLVLKDWMAVGNLIDGFDCIVREIADPEAIDEHFGHAIEYHSERGEGMTLAYQVVWPGAVNGLYPWEEGCAEEVRDHQPPLYSAGTVH